MRATCIRYAVALCVCATSVFLSSAKAYGELTPAIASNNYTEGYYTFSQLHTYGVPVTLQVAPGGSYTFGSQVVGVGLAWEPPDERFYRLEPPTAYHQPSTYPDYIGSKAMILAGTNTTGVQQTVSMAWRTRTDIERNAMGYPLVGNQFPPMPWDGYAQVSDLLDLNGVVGAYVLQMDIDPSTFVWERPGTTMEWLAQNDRIYVGWLEDEAHKSGGYNPNVREWVNATEGNTTHGIVIANFQGSFSEFLTAYPDFTPDGYLGSYGVDLKTNTVWAVLDHNSEFGATPEPASMTLLAIGAAAMLRRRRAA